MMRLVDAAVIAVLATIGWSETALAQTVQAPGGFVPRHALSYGSAGGAATAVDETHPLPVVASGRGAALSDRSGTITTAATAQPLAPANPARTGFMVQNLSSADLWVTAGGSATAGPPSFRVGAGQLFEFPASGVPTTALSILGGVAGQAFAAREW